MSRRCGSSKPTPAALNGLAMKPGKTRRKAIEGNADTIIRQTNIRTVQVGRGIQIEGVIAEDLMGPRASLQMGPGRSAYGRLHRFCLRPMLRLRRQPGLIRLGWLSGAPDGDAVFGSRLHSDVPRYSSSSWQCAPCCRLWLWAQRGPGEASSA